MKRESGAGDLAIGRRPQLLGGPSSKDRSFGLLERPLPRVSGPTPGFVIRLLWTPCDRLAPADGVQQQRPTSDPPIRTPEQSQPVQPFPHVPVYLAAPQRGTRASPRWPLALHS